MEAEDRFVSDDIEDPTAVWLVDAETGKRYAALVFASGGYDMTILEGALVGEFPQGMWLTTDDRDEAGQKDEQDVSDFDCVWILDDDTDEEETSLPPSSYRLERATPEEAAGWDYEEEWKHE